MNENAVSDGAAFATAANTACPRCGVAFRCGVSDAPCACSAVPLDDGLRAFVRERWQGCLCVPCLQAIRAAPEPT